MVDGASNIKWSDSKIVLEGPGNILIEHSFKFQFRTRNNQAEYESLIINMVLALEMGALRLK